MLRETDADAREEEKETSPAFGITSAVSGERRGARLRFRIMRAGGAGLSFPLGGGFFCRLPSSSSSWRVMREIVIV